MTTDVMRLGRKNMGEGGAPRQYTKVQPGYRANQDHDASLLYLRNNYNLNKNPPSGGGCVCLPSGARADLKLAHPQPERNES